MSPQEYEQASMNRDAEADETSPATLSIQTIDQENHETDGNAEALTRHHVWNLVFCLLAWGFTVSNVTMVIGTSAMVILSLGGSEQIASMPLGTFFLGSSFVSLALTPWIFASWGRKHGFFTGIALGLVGTAFGATSVALASPALYCISTAFFGMATGLGFSLRFAAVEVVPPQWAARAVTLVVSGGVLGAFAGPEASAAVRDMFGSDLPYMGVFFMTGVFYVGNFLATALVTFPSVQQGEKQDSSTKPFSLSDQADKIRQVTSRRQFWVPMLVASVSWAAMGMPMSLVRVVMDQLGYTSKHSLRVIEIHFLGMYAPGFFTGHLIKQWGPKVICYLGVLIFVLAQVVAFLPDPTESEALGLWITGLSLVGVGWNFGFTASTVWLVEKGPVGEQRTLQAANDCLMFLLAGAWLFASSYIYQSGSSGSSDDDVDGLLDGWYKLNWVVIGLIGFVAVLLLVDALLDRVVRRQDAS